MDEQLLTKAQIGVHKKLSTIKEYDIPDHYVHNVKGFTYKKIGDKYKPMASFRTRKGYTEYVLTDTHGKKKHYQAHRLTALLFIPNPKNLPHVNHNKGDKTKNGMNDIGWMSISDNNKHKYRVLGYTQKKKES